MRKMQKPPAEEPRKKKRDPLAEGLQVIPNGPSGRRLWNRMTYEEIIDFAKKLVKEKEISGRSELSKEDQGLYRVLLKRNLIGAIGFEEKHRSWKDMSDDEIIGLAKNVMEKNEISGKTELKNADPGLYRILRIRKLLGEIDFEKKRRKYRSWSSISDEEIVGLAKKTMTENDVCARYEFRNVDQGLYDILKTRGLLGKVGFKKKLRPWKDMSDEEIVELARRVMKEQRITGKGELQKKDVGLYFEKKKTR